MVRQRQVLPGRYTIFTAAAGGTRLIATIQNRERARYESLRCSDPGQEKTNESERHPAGEGVPWAAAGQLGVAKSGGG